MAGSRGDAPVAKDIPGFWVSMINADNSVYDVLNTFLHTFLYLKGKNFVEKKNIFPTKYNIKVLNVQSYCGLFFGEPPTLSSESETGV